MTTLRVEPEALRAVGQTMQAFPTRLSSVQHDLTAAAGATGAIGEPSASSASQEFLRRLAILTDIAAVTVDGLARGIVRAGEDYARADDVVVRSEGG